MKKERSAKQADTEKPAKNKVTSGGSKDRNGGGLPAKETSAGKGQTTGSRGTGGN